MLFRSRAGDLLVASELSPFIEPYAKSLQKTGQLLNDYRKASKFVPERLNPNEQEFLKTVRNVGLTLKDEGVMYEPKSLQNALERAKNLTDEQFFNLTGFEKSSIEERIQQLKSGEIQKPKNEQSTVDGLTREEYIREYLRNIERPERVQQLRNLSTDILGTGWTGVDFVIPEIYNIKQVQPNIIDALNEKLDKNLSRSEEHTS